jgi:acid phosphatase family membrane protein YuiD
MDILRIITSNHIINVGFTSWCLAQILKTLIAYLLTNKIQVERLWGAGGMPSSHSALVISIAIGMARMNGFDSPEFGFTLAFAAIVVYDAMGVRRAAGEHAKVLNRIVFEVELPWIREELKNQGEEPDEQLEKATPLLQKHLREYLGHTPLEVLGGCMLGILVALFMPLAG